MQRKNTQSLLAEMGTKENHDTHFLKSEVSACEILSDFLITCRYVGADNVGAIKVN